LLPPDKDYRGDEKQRSEHPQRVGGALGKSEPAELAKEATFR
jgi:hypothetical protein